MDIKSIVLSITFTLFSIQLWAQDNAVILVYHHVSNSTPPVTSVSPDTFKEHMRYLDQHHKVLPLQQVIESLQNNRPLPDKAVVITFDDGYKNIYENAHPILREFGFPYTIFVNPPLIGKAHYQLDWKQVQEMASQGVSFANHGNQHTHMLTREKNETEQAWLQRSIEDVQQAEQQLLAKLGYSLKYFAYPYGEFNNKLKNSLADLGYIGFAQHSGAISSFSDFSALPRFPAAGIYSNLKTLKIKMSALAMPVSEVSQQDPVITSSPQKLAFNVKDEDLRPSQINCFQNNEVLPKEINQEHITLSIKTIDKAGRHRINCTAVSKQDSSRYYWFSQPFLMATPQGQWLD
ncbi:polysaccharide deacetylase family protein [Paraglaciecola sp. 2405UD69-4]|uniref:polysaccharide deacetylase family protein n=1 Tax=Paraglaciecola sp. 2405UD69-4 TaxID=3391836 RepID=UPI0039C99A24